MADENKSALGVAIESVPRKAHEFEVNAFFGLGGQPIHKVAIWVSQVSEQEIAVAAARKAAAAVAAGDDDAKRDPDLLDNIKHCEMLFRVCRRCEPGDAERGYMYPAFPGPDWMRKNMSTDQVAVLLNLYAEVVRKESPLRRVPDGEGVEAIATACADNFYSDIPEAALAPFTREWLTTAFALVALKLKETRAALDAAVKALAAEEVPGGGEGGPVGPGPGAPGVRGAPEPGEPGDAGSAGGGG